MCQTGWSCSSSSFYVEVSEKWTQDVTWTWETASCSFCEQHCEGKSQPDDIIVLRHHVRAQVFVPASADHTCAGVLKEMMLTWSLRCCSSSLNSFGLQLQSAKISTSLVTRLDTRDSMCFKFTRFSCRWAGEESRSSSEERRRRCDGGHERKWWSEGGTCVTSHLKQSESFDQTAHLVLQRKHHRRLPTILCSLSVLRLVDGTEGRTPWLQDTIKTSTTTQQKHCQWQQRYQQQ